MANIQERRDKSGKLISYSKKDGECVEIKACGNMGHANGTTYNPNTNKFYVAKTHKEYRTASCSTYKGSSKEYAGSFSLPRVTSGIAYDESNDCYYLSKGNELYVCSSNFSVQKFIHKKARYNHAQDIGVRRLLQEARQDLPLLRRAEKAGIDRLKLELHPIPMLQIRLHILRKIADIRLLVAGMRRQQCRRQRAHLIPHRG